jgi:hypothetical protein
MTCDNGESYYFYKVELTLASRASGAGGATAQDLGDNVSAGTTVTVVDLNPDDAFYSDRASIVGQVCTVEGDLHRNDNLWYGGGLSCPDGSKYFYKVAVARGGAAPRAASASAAVSGSLPKGTRVTITDVSPEDAYYSDRSGIIGKSCTTDDATSDNGGGWSGGPISCDDGSSYYFYKAALSAGGGYAAAPSGSAGQDLGASVKDGTKVRITDLGSSDLYYDTREAFIGKPCTVSGDLLRNDGLFYAGGLTCEGDYWYFAAVSVERR